VQAAIGLLLNPTAYFKRIFSFRIFLLHQADKDTTFDAARNRTKIGMEPVNFFRRFLLHPVTILMIGNMNATDHPGGKGEK
jgi:hypothetical protein